MASITKMQVTLKCALDICAFKRHFCSHYWGFSPLISPSQPILMVFMPLVSTDFQYVSSAPLRYVLSSSVVSLCDPVDYSLPGSSIHGILQAILEWPARPSSRGSFQPRD